MNICMIGTGYVGLVTGACFANLGNHVWCVDVDEVKINNLKSVVLPIYEPGLKDIVEKSMKEGRLDFTTNIKIGLAKAICCFIAVGTPSSEDGSADLSYVLNVARAIGQSMNHDLVVVTKSTVPVGTAKKIRDIIEHELKKRGREDLKFDVVANPEFLKEGTAVDDFMHPDRIVIGIDNVHTAELMKQLYQPFVSSENSILMMDIQSAEITKYASNAMLATRISFMNEIAQLCDKVGADIDSIRVGLGADQRIGSHFLYAGAGYGGSCFPKDVKELISTGRKNNIEMAIATAVDIVNERQKYYLVAMIKKRFGEDLRGKRFGIWGLAFKAQTDDVREAPSLVIVQSIINMGANITVYDPEAMEEAKKAFADDSYIQYADNMMEAINEVDALLLITDWPQFRQPDFTEMKQRMRQYIIFDGRNQYDPVQMKTLGFEYYCIGRNCYVK